MASTASKNYTYLAPLSCYLVINYKKIFFLEREGDKQTDREQREKERKKTDRQIEKTDERERQTNRQTNRQTDGRRTKIDLKSSRELSAQIS